METLSGKVTVRNTDGQPATLLGWDRSDSDQPVSLQLQVQTAPPAGAAVLLVVETFLGNQGAKISRQFQAVKAGAIQRLRFVARAFTVTAQLVAFSNTGTSTSGRGATPAGSATVSAVGGVGANVDSLGDYACFLCRDATVAQGDAPYLGAGNIIAGQLNVTNMGGSAALFFFVFDVSDMPLAGFTITNAGTGYTSAPTVNLTGGGSGAGFVAATAHATIAGGVVTGIVLDTPGQGYTSAPTVSLTGGGGSNAAATAQVTVNAVPIAPVVMLTAIGSVPLDDHLRPAYAFSTGVCWGLSTTLGAYTPAANTALAGFDFKVGV